AWLVESHSAAGGAGTTTPTRFEAREDEGVARGTTTAALSRSSTGPATSSYADDPLTTVAANLEVNRRLFRHRETLCHERNFVRAVNARFAIRGPLFERRCGWRHDQAAGFATTHPLAIQHADFFGRRQSRLAF